MELLCDSEYARLHELMDKVQRMEVARPNLPPSDLVYLDDVKFLIVCLNEARDHIWSMDH